MRCFLDSSVLVAGSVKAHPHFIQAHQVLEESAVGAFEGLCAAHSITECFSALTMIPVQPRITPAEASTIIAENVIARFKIVPARAAFYRAAVVRCVTAGVAGGTIYDALLLECARSVNADRIYTLNRAHFLALAPDLADRITSP
jgi:predicted nucleic acid-binding protein